MPIMNANTRKKVTKAEIVGLKMKRHNQNPKLDNHTDNFLPVRKVMSKIH